MAGQLLGIAAIGGLAAIVYCSRGNRRKGIEAVDEVSDGKVVSLKTPADLDAIFTSGRKAVVYLSASW